MKPFDSKKQLSGAHPGFTLTELLVVILIIAVLAALSLVGVRKMRDMADKATATRNLSQLQLANMTYATDHNGDFVPIRANDDKGKATRWFSDTKYVEYLTGQTVGGSDNKLAEAPPHMLDPKVVRARKPLSGKIYTSYGMNDTGLQLGGSPGLKSAHNMNRIPEPARSMAFATATDFRITYNNRFRWNFDNPNDSKTAGGEIAYRHGKKVLAVYFDGHVGELSRADLEEIDRARGGRNSAFWQPRQ